jgi:AraC-like DNA-binding protein
LDKPFREEPWYEQEQFDIVFPFYLWNEVIETGGKIQPTHWQKQFEVYYVLEGKMDIILNGKNYTLDKDDILFVQPELMHGYFYQSKYTHSIIFLFGTDFFKELLIDLNDKMNLKSIFNRKTIFRAKSEGELHTRMVKYIKSISDEFLNKNAGYRLAIQKSLYEIALLFLRDLPPVESQAEQAIESLHTKILERVLSFVHENYSDYSITLEKAAEVAILSKFYFSRFFREKTGLTFHTYLSRIRVNKAIELLTETEISITDIAYQAGFESLKTFNRLIKKYTSVTPSQLRWEKK